MAFWERIELLVFFFVLICIEGETHACYYNLSFDYSGVGKTSLVHLILKGSSVSRPPQTVGCTVGVKVSLFLLYEFVGIDVTEALSS